MSTGDPNRRVLAWSVITATCAAGGWLLWVGPMRADLARARASLRELRAELSSADAGDEPQAPGADGSAPMAARIESIRTRSRAASDSGALHHAVMSLAAREGVRVTRVEPKASGARPGSGETEAGDSVSLSIAAEGEYGALVRFLDGLEREAGFCLVRAAHLQPASAKGLAIVATIETSHHDFASSMAGAEAGEGGHE